MKSKSILKSGVLFLIIALIIGSLGVIVLAKNNANKGGWGQGMQQGNQTQLQERERNQTQLQECEEECNENCVGKCDGGCTGQCDGNPVQVSGAELRAMKISDIADLWEIDAATLLNEIVNTLNLKNTYTIENTVNDLRGEYRFSPFQIKDIADKLKVS
jgi:hypothetical protein